MSPTFDTDALYIMVGGFLGAGKSTTLVQLAERLTAAGHTVGLITNDQGSGLVDTAAMRAHGFAVEEIPGGCFCCRFDSLVEAAGSLTAETRPSVFLAEPVGSCTDLVASVSYPLRRIYGDRCRIAPFTVLVDPRRAMRMFGLTPGRTFSRKVRYIYEKQLEEADAIAINKCDLLTSQERTQLRDAIGAKFPHAELREISARDGEGVDAWLEWLTSREMRPRSAMALDYGIYAEGEALLAWVNATVRLRSDRAVDGNALITALMEDTRDRLLPAVEDIAHLKMTLSPGTTLGGIASASLVGREFVAELGLQLSDTVERAELIVNLRAEGDPDVAREALLGALRARSRAAGVELEVEHIEAFRPAPPQPTHRLEAP